MRFRLRLSRLAREDILLAYEWVAARAPVSAERWLERFTQSIQTLEHNPARCPLAMESSRVKVELREYLFGKRPYVYRVIFLIRDDLVAVLRVLRAQRRFLSARQVEDVMIDFEE